MILQDQKCRYSAEVQVCRFAEVQVKLQQVCRGAEVHRHRYGGSEMLNRCWFQQR